MNISLGKEVSKILGKNLELIFNDNELYAS